MSAHSSDLKAAIEAAYDTTDASSFVDNPDERQLTSTSSCYSSWEPCPF